MPRKPKRTRLSISKCKAMNAKKTQKKDTKENKCVVSENICSVASFPGGGDVQQGTSVDSGRVAPGSK